MRMNKIKLVLFLFVVLISDSAGQYFEFSSFNFHPDYPQLSDLNPYYFSENPALMNFDSDEEVIVFKSAMDMVYGDFKRFDQPDEIIHLFQSFCGKKKMNDKHQFKGYFIYTHQLLNEKKWISNREVPQAMAFSVGDSSTGSFHYQGFELGTQYFYEMNQKNSLGLSIQYRVETGLKKVFPKPLNHLNDIDFRFAHQYQFVSNRCSFFNSLKLHQGKEIVDYSIDYTKDEVPLIYKFRGIDFPIVLEKNSLERYYEKNALNYQGGLWFHAKKILIRWEIGQSFWNIFDQPNNPLEQGEWVKQFYCLDLDYEKNICENYMLQANIGLMKNHSWSKHPEFDISIAEVNNLEFNSEIGLIGQLNPISIHALFAGFKFHDWTEQGIIQAPCYHFNAQRPVFSFDYFFHTYFNEKIIFDGKFSCFFSSAISEIPQFCFHSPIAHSMINSILFQYSKKSSFKFDLRIHYQLNLKSRICIDFKYNLLNCDDPSIEKFDHRKNYTLFFYFIQGI